MRGKKVVSAYVLGLCFLVCFCFVFLFFIIFSLIYFFTFVKKKNSVKDL